MGDREFERYLQYLCEGLGHADRHEGLMGYCQGLMLPLERKSIEPLAAGLAPKHVRARHQSLHHFVAQSDWSDAAVLERVRDWTLPRLSGKLYWIVDDTGFPKKGNHSVGVARQYCGQLGKQDNCQVAVSLSIATEQASVPLAFQLYLPKPWADDARRRLKAYVPNDIVFATKPQMALSQIRQALVDGVSPGVVLADAGYGNDSAFRDGLQELSLRYAVGIQSSTTVWAPGTEPLPPRKWKGVGRKPKLLRRSAEQTPVAVRELALSLEPRCWKRIAWRQGTQGTLASRFAAVRVRSAHRDYWQDVPNPEQWLLIEWPKQEPEPIKYWLSSLRADCKLSDLVAITKMRWRIERDYQELKQEFGLADYEGRGWRGFHHHATLCIAAYAYIVGQRLGGRSKKNSARPTQFALPADYVPRGRPTHPAPRRRLDRNTPMADRLASAKTS